MKPEQLFRVALATVCVIGVVLAVTLLARGVWQGVNAFVALVFGG